MTSENVSANRMANQASERVADTVQEIVEEVAETHSGKPQEEVASALQEKWTEKHGEATPPLSPDKADEYAEHISDGTDVTIVPASQPPPASAEDASGDPGRA